MAWHRAIRDRISRMVHAASPVEIRTNAVLLALDAVEALLGGCNGVDELLNIEESVGCSGAVEMVAMARWRRQGSIVGFDRVGWSALRLIGSSFCPSSAFVPPCSPVVGDTRGLRVALALSGDGGGSCGGCRGRSGAFDHDWHDQRITQTKRGCRRPPPAEARTPTHPHSHVHPPGPSQPTSLVFPLIRQSGSSGSASSRQSRFFGSWPKVRGDILPLADLATLPAARRAVCALRRKCNAMRTIVSASACPAHVHEPATGQQHSTDRHACASAHG